MRTISAAIQFTGKSPVHDHQVSLGHDRSGFVLQRWRDTPNEIEQTRRGPARYERCVECSEGTSSAWPLGNPVCSRECQKPQERVPCSFLV
jgi:hypothetical protein